MSSTEPSPVHKQAADVEQAIHDMLWLAREGAWRGITAVIAERKRQVELSFSVAHDRRNEPGHLSGRGAVMGATGAYMAENDPDPEAAQVLCAEGAALLAAEIDRLHPWHVTAAAGPVREAG